MLTSARILLMLILASFLVANCHGRQDLEISTFKSKEDSTDSSFESSSDFESGSSSESSSDFESGSSSESSSDFESESSSDFESGSSSNFESESSSDFESGSSSDFESGSSSESSSDFESGSSSESSSDFSFESSTDSSTLTLEEIDTESSGKSSNLTESSTEVEISSGTEELEVSMSNEIPPSDLNSEKHIPSFSRGTFPMRITAPVELSIEDLTETSTETDISSGTEEPEMASSSGMVSGEGSSEIDYEGSTALQKIDEDLVELSVKGSTETITEADIFSGTEEPEVASSSGMVSGEGSSEIDYEGSAALQKINEDFVEPSVEGSTETSTEADISSETEEDEMKKSDEIISGEGSSEIDIAPLSSAIPTTELNVSVEKTTASPDHKGTEESSDSTTIPASIQNPTTVMPTSNEFSTLSSTANTKFVDSSDSITLPEQEIAQASNSSKLVSIPESQENKTNFGVLFGVVLGSTVGTALLATLAFLLYRKRKNNWFAHQRFF